MNSLVNSKNRSKRETAASFYQFARKRWITGTNANSSSSPGFSACLAVVHRRFFLTARTAKKQKEYKDDNLRLSPLAQRIDFTGFHERAQVTRPTAPFVSFAFFFLLSSSSSSRTHVRMRQKEIPCDVPRCPSRASQKRAVRSSITTVRTVRREMIDEREDGKRERKGQEEIGGWVEIEKGEEDGEWKRTARWRSLPPSWSTLINLLS